MGMRPSDKDIEKEHREAQRKARAARKAVCVDAIQEWNRLMERRFKPGWSPAIGVAIAAEFYWLEVLCPGCRQVKHVDLRPLDRHPQTEIYSIVSRLSCQNCKPSSPRAQPMRLLQGKGFTALNSTFKRGRW